MNQELLQKLINSAQIAREAARHAMSVMFPIGSFVRDIHGIVGMVHCYPAGEFAIAVVFENGNVWSRQTEDLTPVPESEVPEYYRKVFGIGEKA